MKSPNRLTNLSLLSFSVAIGLVAQVALCDVEESSVDLSKFKLRHVDRRQFSRTRIDQPIRDLATAAQFLRELFYLDDFQVRCVAYGHLFKLVDLNKSSKQYKSIKQDLVGALTIVADIDRAVYLHLFKKHQPNRLEQLFAEAIESLEANQSNVARDTWLDLIRCASGYMQSLKGFLSQPKRRAQVESFEAFKSLPADHEKWLAEGQLKPQVERLRRKYDQLEPKMLGLTQEEVGKARELVESFDDNQLAELRRQFLEAASAQPEEVPAPAPEERKAAGKRVNVSIQVEFIAPKVEKKVDDNRLAPQSIDEKSIESRMAILAVIAKRIRLAPGEYSIDGNATRVNVNSAFDFQTHWNDLKQIQRDGNRVELSEKVRKQLDEFLAKDEYVEAAKRLGDAANNYASLMQLAEVLKERDGKYKSMEELESLYGQLDEALGKIDTLLDVYDFARVFRERRRAELIEFKAINRLIENDGFW